MDKKKWRFKATTATFIVCALMLLGMAVGFFTGHTEVMILSLSLVIIFLLFANTLLLYALVYELDSAEGGSK
ncbi:MAG: hypothetical protein QME81_10125 [bacterium]|nr:hypothetical protein [bacterium]